MNKGRREGQGERANNNKEFSYVFVWCLFRSLIGPKSGQNPKKKKHPNLQPHMCLFDILLSQINFIETNKFFISPENQLNHIKKLQLGSLSLFSFSFSFFLSFFLSFFCSLLLFCYFSLSFFFSFFLFFFLFFMGKKRKGKRQLSPPHRINSTTQHQQKVKRKPQKSLTNQIKNVIYMCLEKYRGRDNQKKIKEGKGKKERGEKEKGRKGKKETHKYPRDSEEQPRTG